MQIPPSSLFLPWIRKQPNVADAYTCDIVTDSIFIRYVDERFEIISGDVLLKAAQDDDYSSIVERIQKGPIHAEK